MKELTRYGLILALICAAASAALAAVNALTRPKIIAQLKLEEENSLKEVLPQGVKFVPVKSAADVLYYKVYNQEDQLIGLAFKAQGKGYSSTVETMVGMDKDGSINAIKVLNQNETPGLGARIVEIRDDNTIWDLLRGKKNKKTEMQPWFQEQFKGKKPDNLKEIQAITGATISSKAVIDSVQKKAQEVKKAVVNEK